jgi:hypothetical protein
MASDLKDKASHNPELANFLKAEAFNSNLSDEEYFKELSKVYRR